MGFHRFGEGGVPRWFLDWDEKKVSWKLRKADDGSHGNGLDVKRRGKGVVWGSDG